MTAIVTIDHPAYFDRLAEVEAAHWWSWGMWRIAAHFLNTFDLRPARPDACSTSAAAPA